MNAVCHRDYEGNGPIQFYQYDNRIEILNPGGLYGKANPRNFPWVNDYRNGVVAEAMKVTGFVNRFSRGVQRVQEELKTNGNGDAYFNLDLETAFLVKVPISQKAISSRNETKNETKNETINVSKSTIEVYNAIVSSPNDTRANLINKLNVSESTVNRAILELKQKGIIEREGGKRYGYWKIIKSIRND